MVVTCVLCHLRFIWLEMTEIKPASVLMTSQPWAPGAEEQSRRLDLRSALATAVLYLTALSSAGFSSGDKEAAGLRR